MIDLPFTLSRRLLNMLIYARKGFKRAELNLLPCRIVIDETSEEGWGCMMQEWSRL
jgi:hypothetical protein